MQPVLRARVSKVLRTRGVGWRLTFPCTAGRGHEGEGISKCILNYPHHDVNRGEGRQKNNILMCKAEAIRVESAEVVDGQRQRA